MTTTGIVFVLWALLLSLPLIVECFHLKSTPYTSSIENNQLRFLGFDTYPTTTISTSLRMIENKRDPDALLQMVEELAMQEFTLETMTKMEEVQIALTTFLEETSAALLEQEQQPKPLPPSTPPPGALLMEDEDDERQGPQWQRQDRDMATDLAQAGKALEFLQERLRLEEENLLQAEWALQQEPFEEQQGVTFDEQDILYEAEEALRKSREAAEKRKIEAERRSLTAVRISAGYRQQQLQKQVQEQQQQQRQEEQRLQQEESETETFGRVDSYGDENESIQNQQGGGIDDVPRTRKRPTMELGSLFGKRGTKESPGTRDNSNDGIHATFDQETDSRIPEGVPVLCNWVQDADGSITGYIRGSMNFRDGSKISTSCVSEGARGGTTVATESGSRYFLEEPTTTTEDVEASWYQNDVALQSSMPTTEDGYITPKAPDGVPTVKSWEVLNGGEIIGLIYDSPYADDGDYIETSPITEGEIDNFSVVSTLSGSRYFLSGNPPENSLDTLENFKDERIPNRSRRGGTISLSNSVSLPPQQKPRSTFSVFDLFENNSDKRTKKNNNSNMATYLHDAPPRPLPPPSLDKVPPEGTPTLTGCVFNDNGTITGYVFGSSKIDDGFLITTSRIVDGKKGQFETVTTASGSLYYLG